MLGSKQCAPLAGLATCGMLLLAGCGGGMSGAQWGAPPPLQFLRAAGASMVTLTDAKGDFLSYTST